MVMVFTSISDCYYKYDKNTRRTVLLLQYSSSTTVVQSEAMSTTLAALQTTYKLLQTNTVFK